MPSPIFPNGVSAGDTTQTDTVLWARSTVPGLVEFNLSTSPNFSDHVGQATASVVDPMIPVKVQISGSGTGNDLPLPCNERNGRFGDRPV